MKHTFKVCVQVEISNARMIRIQTTSILYLRINYKFGTIIKITLVDVNNYHKQFLFQVGCGFDGKMTWYPVSNPQAMLLNSRLT